jgi:hypothetical protein
VLFASIIPLIALMMWAKDASETSINFYQTIERSKPEDNIITAVRSSQTLCILEDLYVEFV